MGDIIFQSQNQNSIYVLNSNYGPHEDLSRLSLISSNYATNKNVSKRQHSLPFISDDRNFSVSSRTLQNNFCNIANICEVAETIGSPITIVPHSLSAAAASATAITTSVSSCLPLTAAAFQKLFNYSYVANDSVSVVNGDGCRDAILDVATALNTCKIKPTYKKKIDYVKPSLIAKKTKFRKYIENEKWAAFDEHNMENGCQYSNSRIRCIGYPTPYKLHVNSSVKESNAAESTTLTTTVTSMSTSGPVNHIVKHYWNGKTDSDNEGGKREGYIRKNNWSGNGDKSNQQQQHFEMLKKNTYGLYKEAAELLGLSCTLCDNCRCLDCQSSYFDCDDSDNFSDEYDEEPINKLGNSIELILHADFSRDEAMTTSHKQQYKTEQLQQEQQNNIVMCTNATCNTNELMRDGGENSKLCGDNKNETFTHTEQTDVIKQEIIKQGVKQQNNEFENFTIFNRLSLTPLDNEINETGGNKA